MNINLTERSLTSEGLTRFRLARRLIRRIEPLFDSALPLPRLGRKPDDFPGFATLMELVPQPYIDSMGSSYVCMTSLATAALPTMLGLVHAEPFFEWLMHSDLHQGKYRDHLVHQFRVATIGDMLLDQVVDGQTILQRATTALSPRLSPITNHPEQFIRLSWWLIGMFHDCMYPYQHHRRHFVVLEKAVHLPLAGPTHTVWFDAHQTVADGVGGVTSEDLRRCQEGHHQFAGAAELLMQNKKYENEVNTFKPPQAENATIRMRRNLLLSLAAEAILTHHKLRRPNRPIRFEDCPLGFLLVLSDEFHEAGRPLAISSTSPKRRHTVVKFQPGKIRSVRISTDAVSPPNLNISFNCAPGTTLIQGKSLSSWRANKKRTLREMLSCATAPGNLFREINVS